MTTPRTLTSADVYIPPTASYLVGCVRQHATVHNRYILEIEASPFQSRLCAVKIENRVDSTNLYMKLETLDGDGQTIDEVETTVHWGRYTIREGAEQETRYNGVWIAVPRNAATLKVYAGPQGSPTSPDSVPIELVGDELVIDGQGVIRASSEEGLRVYSQDGTVRLRNDYTADYYVWTKVDGTWAPNGDTVDKQGGTAQPDVTRAEMVGVSQNEDDEPSQKFQVFDIDQPTVRLSRGSNGRIRSDPFVVTTPFADKSVTVTNDTTGFTIDVWAEGGKSQKQSLGPGDSTDPAIGLPYSTPTRTYQSSVHWALQDDPKIIVRHFDLAQSPKRDRDG